MTTPPGAVTSPPLTRLDRCDRCSAAARYRALLAAGELLFCGHHAHQHRTHLLEVGAKLSADPDHTDTTARHDRSRFA